jgi:hypothetical protein
MTEAEPATANTKGRKPRNPKQLRLPPGVLVRVDVLEDEHGHIHAYTRERLSSGWSDERNEVASLLVRTGADVLDEFKEEEDDGEGDDEGEGDGPGVKDPRKGPSPRFSLKPDFRLLYR